MTRNEILQAKWKVNDTIVYVEGDEEDYAICKTDADQTNCLPYEMCLELAQIIANEHNKNLVEVQS